MSAPITYPVDETGPGPGPGSKSGRQLLDLPNETLNEILSNLDMESLFQMSHVNKLFKSIVDTHWPSILHPILERDFAPVETLFRVFDVCSTKALTAFDGFCDGDVLINDRPVVCSSVSGKEAGTWTTRLSLNDGLAVFKVCLTVKKWEREFARLRFAGCPEYSRTLRPHELERLRLGLYVWWRFARYFHAPFCFSEEAGHGFEDQRRFWLRRPHHSPDIRCNFMRQFSTTQLHEISDVWDTIRSAVGREVCPSIAAVRESDYDMSRVDASRIGWGDSVENDVILSTIMKLPPEDILHLLMFRHRYTKASLVQFVRLKNPSIEQSIETFSEAILLTVEDRELAIFREIAVNGPPGPLGSALYFPPSGFPSRHGGVIDYRKKELEKLRERYNGDAGQDVYVYPVEDLGEQIAEMFYVKAAVHPGLLVASL